MDISGAAAYGLVFISIFGFIIYVLIHWNREDVYSNEKPKTEHRQLEKNL